MCPFWWLVVHMFGCYKKVKLGQSHQKLLFLAQTALKKIELTMQLRVRMWSGFLSCSFHYISISVFRHQPFVRRDLYKAWGRNKTVLTVDQPVSGHRADHGAASPSHLFLFIGHQWVGGKYSRTPMRYGGWPLKIRTISSSTSAWRLHGLLPITLPAPCAPLL
jgi:hypothetical protein